MTTIVKQLFFLLIILNTSGCAISHKFGPYRGQVLDAETDEPIAGAVVYMEFKTKYSAIVDAVSSYVDSEEVLTDEQGKFDITYRGLIFRPGHLWDWQPNLCIFKPGYATYPGNQITTITPEPEYDPIMPNQFFTIRLPRLKNIHERRRNLLFLYVNPDVPPENRKEIIILENLERINLGLSPLPKGLLEKVNK